MFNEVLFVVLFIVFIFVIVSRLLKARLPFFSIALEGAALWGILYLPIVLFGENADIAFMVPPIVCIGGFLAGLWVGVRLGKKDAWWGGFLSIFSIAMFYATYNYLIFLAEGILGNLLERTKELPAAVVFGIFPALLGVLSWFFYLLIAGLFAFLGSLFGGLIFPDGISKKTIRTTEKKRGKNENK